MDPRVVAIAVAVALTYYAGVETVKGVKKLGHLIKVGVVKIVRSDKPANRYVEKN